MPSVGSPSSDRDSTALRRRKYLKTVGAVGTASVASLSGCTGSGNGGGGGSTATTESGANGAETTTGGQEDYQALAAVNFLGADVWQAYKKGFNEAASVWDISTTIESAGGDLNKQISQIQSGLQRGIDMLLGQAPSNAGMKQWVNIATENNIPMVPVWVTAPWLTPVDAGKEFVQFHIPHMIRNGRQISKVLFESLGGSGNVVYISGAPGTVGNFALDKGMQRTFEEYPDINLLGEPIPGNWIREDARKAMSDFVSQFGDQIDGVIAQNDAEAMGALTVCQENDLDVNIMGHNAIQAVLKEMAQDKADDEPQIVATSGARPAWMGGWSLVKAYDWLQGWRPKVPERMMWGGFDIVVRDSGPYEGVVEPMNTFVSPNDYLEKIYSGETPYDWERMSVVEAGEDAWDPQNNMVPIRKSQFSFLRWTEKNKPSGYSLPDVYNDADLFDQVEQMYKDHYQRDPFA